MEFCPFVRTASPPFGTCFDCLSSAMKISFFERSLGKFQEVTPRRARSALRSRAICFESQPESEARWRILSHLTDIADDAVPHCIPTRVMQPGTQVDLTENRD